MTAERKPPSATHVRTWQDAETNAAAWMREWGYRDAHAAPGGPDGGIDVSATGALGQVKFRASQVGRPDLQRFVGARGDREADLLFFTGTSYSRNAVEYAALAGIALFTYTLDGAMMGANAKATAIASRRSDTTSLQAQNSYRPASKLPKRSGRNWRAGFGYFFLLAFTVNVFNPHNYRTPTQTTATVFALLVMATLATISFVAHYRSEMGTWFPHR